jgi:serine/threonine-protein kinase
MTLAAGTRLGPYEIGGLVGAGGMGEVYRAHDPRLSRSVAIKILPPSFAADPLRRQRFEREAKAIGALNHPNIVAVYDVGAQGATPYLVTELLEGQTLRDKLATRIPVPQAIDYAIQIADGLAAAHAQGIFHRDLKPENVFITRQGRLKILDFGLAKAPMTGSPEEATATSPAHLQESAPGTVLGTVGYMSPEQVLGNAVDHRSDLFSFGVVLFEMLAGRRPFQRDSAIETMHAIIRDEPSDIITFEASVSPLLSDIVRGCLAKDVNDRWQSASDLEQALKWAGAHGVETARPPSGAVATNHSVGVRRVAPAVFMWASVAALVAAAAGTYAWRASRPAEKSPSSGIARLSIILKPSELISSLDRPIVALSPDGARLAYVRRTETSTSLYMRSLDAFQSVEIPGTASARNPFFSPDGKWIGFFADGKLKKIATAGGTPVEISATPEVPLGASWTQSGLIVLGSVNGSGLQTVSNSGGDPTAWKSLGTTTPTETEAWPEALPDGAHVLVTVIDRPQSQPFVAVKSLTTGERTKLVEGSFGRYMSPGILAYVRGTSVMATRFDPNRLELIAEPVVVLENVPRWEDGGAVQFSISSSGTLVYLSPSDGPAPTQNLMLVERDGHAKQLASVARQYFSPRLSPDGRQVAVHIQDGVSVDVWVYDIPGDRWRRLTFDGKSSVPIWTPDGKYITFARATRIYRTAADGSGAAEPLSSEFLGNPHSWSPDGRWLATARPATNGIGGLWLLPFFGTDRHARLFLSYMVAREQNAPAISPDGRWLALVSNESGKRQIHVRPFPSGEGNWMVSIDGGTQPMWSRDGGELFYRDGDRMMAVPVTRGGRTFTAGRPVLLFEGRYESPALRSNYDVTSDGRAFVMVKANEPDASNRQLNIVVNWAEELAHRLPVAPSR